MTKTIPLSLERKSRVYLIDDHPLLVQGITELINADSKMEVVGSTGEWTVALKEIGRENPDVVVLDVTLRGTNGIEVLKNLRVHFPHLRVLMLSMHDENLYAMRSMKAGAHGYIMKESASEEVVNAIRKILVGEVYLSDRVSKQTMLSLLGRPNKNPLSPLSALSDRELEVFQMMADGLTSRQIADRMHLSGKTVETHKSHIKEKLNFKSCTELTQYAIELRA